MKKKDIKVIAYYLPQFHEIPENNEWWGKGFTEWVNVKKATPLFEGHEQPKKPLDENYYDLSDVEVMRWQAQIAKDYGLYGFCFYHYWFYERPLLEKPLENFLKEKSIDFPFCFCWANESWTNGWAKAEASVIMEQKYGDRTEWKKHFEYMLPFFKDDRYIKEENAPFLVVYRPYLYENIIEMLDYWKQLAIENGFSGIKIASQRFEDSEGYSEIYNYLDYHIAYEPEAKKIVVRNSNKWRQIRSIIHDVILERFNIDISINRKIKGPIKFNYDEAWEKIINKKADDEKDIAGSFVNWDNTPRHSRRGTVYIGATPEKFAYYMNLQIDNVIANYRNNYLFLFAWNEWGEGGILEPDELNKYRYLEALKDSISNGINISKSKI